jgi:hypothetical protein
MRRVHTFDKLAEHYRCGVGHLPNFAKRFPHTAAMRSFAMQELAGELGRLQGHVRRLDAQDRDHLASLQRHLGSHT